MDLWEGDKRIKQEPYFGLLQIIISTYPNTLSLKTVAIENEVGFIFNVKVVEENYLLRIYQEEGISFETAKEIVFKILKDYHTE